MRGDGYCRGLRTLCATSRFLITEPCRSGEISRGSSCTCSNRGNSSNANSSRDNGFFFFLMEKMSWAADLEAQQISKLNEHLLVADRIRKARCSVRQGNGWLKNKLLNPSNDSTLAPSFPISSKENALTTRSVDSQALNDHVTRSGTCIPSLESPSLQNPDSGSIAPAVLVTLRGSARQPLSAKTNEAVRSGSKGSHNDENMHQSSQSHNPLLMPTQGVAEAIETPNPAHFIQVPSLLFPHMHSRSFSYKHWTRIWSWGRGRDCNRASGPRPLSRQS